MSQYLGDISAYALAVSQGYTGTEEEYAELMASYATVGQTAVTAAQTATTKASEAATSATTATTKASEATTAATTATNKAAEAQADADAAALDASQAMSAASTATTKATEATTAAATATSAKTDAVAANTAAQSAKTAAQTAQAGAETAAASVQASAAQIATNTNDISQLKSEFAALDNAIYTHDGLVEPDVLSTGWGIAADGCAVNSPVGQSIKKYVVTAGDELYIKALARWQFQSDPSVPTWNNQYIVGGTHDPYEGMVTAPTGATYLLISLYSGDTTSGVYSKESKIAQNAEAIEDVASDVYEIKTEDVSHTDDMTRTCYPTNGGTGTTVDMTGVTETQFACVVLPCKTGDKFTLTGTGGQAYRLWCFTDKSYKILSVANAWATGTDLTITATADGYLIYQVTTSNDYSIKQIDVNVKHIKYEDAVEYIMPMTGFGMFQSIAGVGDSYTEGDMVKANGTWVTKEGVNYLSAIGKRNGLTVKNYGSGGATTETYQSRQAFTEALADDPCDLYILALGQNDINTGMTKGTIADINSDYTQNPNTFYGNYGKIISQLMAHAPNAKYIIMGSWIDGVSSASGIDFQSFNDAIAEIAEHYGFPYVDPFDDPFFTSKFYKKGMSSGHPTAMGYIGMSYAMERLFNKCVLDNASYFKYALLG